MVSTHSIDSRGRGSVLSLSAVDHPVVRTLDGVRAVCLPLRNERQRDRVDTVTLVRLGVAEALSSEDMPKVPGVFSGQD